MSILRRFFYKHFGLGEINRKIGYVLYNLERMKETIMANQEQALSKIADIKNQVVSVGQQIQRSLTDMRTQIEDLQRQVQEGQDMSATLAALDDLKTSVQSTDDLVDDLPVTIPEQ